VTLSDRVVVPLSRMLKWVRVEQGKSMLSERTEKENGSVQLQRAAYRRQFWQLHMSTKFPLISAAAGRLLSTCDKLRTRAQLVTVWQRLQQDKEPAGAGARQEDCRHQGQQQGGGQGG